MTFSEYIKFYTNDFFEYCFKLATTLGVFTVICASTLVMISKNPLHFAEWKISLLTVIFYFSAALAFFSLFHIFFTTQKVLSFDKIVTYKLFPWIYSSLLLTVLLVFLSLIFVLTLALTGLF